jgi:hypothetical protein
MKESEMDGAFSTHGRNEKCLQYFWLKNLTRRDNSEDLEIDGRIIVDWTALKHQL